MPDTARLSTAEILDATQLIDPVFLQTPQFRSDTLENELGLQVVCKIETLNPIRSFKGRGADFFLTRLADETTRLVCASAGNFGQGLAYAARRREMSLDVFAATTANPLKIERMRELGAHVHLAGRDFDEAKDTAKAHALRHGLRYVEDGREPAISEGAGTIAVELLSRSEALDAIVIPLGNGAMLNGIGTWCKAYSPTTRIIGVCMKGARACHGTILARRTNNSNQQHSHNRRWHCCARASAGSAARFSTCYG